MILRSAIKIEEIDDPMRPVEAIMNRISHTEIMELYGIKDYTTIEELLASIAIKKGFLKKTGVPNFDNAARKVIRDYMDGKMNYFTPAPHTEGLEGEEMLDEEILNLARMGAAEDKQSVAKVNRLSNFFCDLRKIFINLCIYYNLDQYTL